MTDGYAGARRATLEDDRDGLRQLSAAGVLTTYCWSDTVAGRDRILKSICEGIDRRGDVIVMAWYEEIETGSGPTFAAIVISRIDPK